MLELFPYVGGFEPPAGDPSASLSVTVDIAGYNVNPSGHFWSRDNYQIYLGCGEIGHGSAENPSNVSIQIIPPDELQGELEALLGRTADVAVTLHTPDGDAEVAAALVLSSPHDDPFVACLGS